jgi:hypothetical protein
MAGNAAEARTEGLNLLAIIIHIYQAGVAKEEAPVVVDGEDLIKKVFGS